jgi:hypothetical protein
MWRHQLCQVTCRYSFYVLYPSKLRHLYHYEWASERFKCLPEITSLKHGCTSTQLNAQSRALLDNPNKLTTIREISRIFCSPKDNYRVQFSLSWNIRLQFITSHKISLRAILILSSPTTVYLPSCLCLSGFPTKTLYAVLPQARFINRPSQLPLFDQANNSLRTNYLLDFVHCLAKILKYNIKHKNHDVSEDGSSSETS